jgi:hypothetical protein
MKTVKLSTDEISLLRNLYSEELGQAELYVKRIKDTLKKLGNPAKESNEISIDMEPKVKKRRGRKSKKSKSIEPKVPKKRGRPKRVIVPTVEVAPVKVTKPVKKESKKKAEPIPKKKIVAKPKVKKRAVQKPVPKKKSAKKVEVVPTTIPTKEVKKVVKKKVTKKRKGISLVNLRKPLPKKEVVAESEPVAEQSPIVEPIDTTTEEPKE